jgi:anti-sigma B factor antagonist
MPEISEVTGPALTLEVVAQPDATVVCCKGVLNSTNSLALKTRVKGLLPGTKHILLDLTALSQMDSSGLGTIVGVYISAKNAGCVLEIINLSARVRELFSLTNLLSVFEPCGRYNMRFP